MKQQKKLRKDVPEPLSGPFLDDYPMNSRFAEAYRTLRTNVDFSFMETDFQSLLITSAGEREGKTVTVSNLAYTISQTGRSVLMIDGDMRNPLLSGLVNSNSSPGLTGLLSHVFSTDIQSGSLEQYGVSDLFRLLSLQKKTGFLRLTSGKQEVELFFLQGKLADLSWLTRPEGKRLATILIKNDFITKEQAQRAIGRQKDTGQKLGFILINMGLLKEEDIKGPLIIHMMEGLRVALSFKSGKFRFKNIPAAGYEQASFDPVDFQRLYSQSILGEEELPYLREKIVSATLETDTSNLFLLPCGELPHNPSELLASERMSFLLSYLKKTFDVLIVDSPPMLPISDALILAPYADGVILIIKEGLMNRNMVRKVVDQLRMARANLIGTVLNEVNTKRNGYYKYYHKHYSRYYGESA